MLLLEAGGSPCARTHTHTHARASFSVLPSAVRPQNCLIQSCAEGILCGHRTGVSARGVAGKPAQLGFVKKCTQGSHPWPPSQCRGWSPERATASQRPVPGGTPAKRQQRVEAIPHLLLPTRQPPTRNQGGVGGRKAACGGRRAETGCRGAPLSPVIKTRSSLCSGRGSISGRGTKIPPASGCSRNRREREAGCWDR